MLERNVQVSLPDGSLIQDQRDHEDNKSMRPHLPRVTLHSASRSQPSVSSSKQLPPVDSPVERSTRNGRARAMPCRLKIHPSGSRTWWAASRAGSRRSAERRAGLSTHKSPVAMTITSRPLGEVLPT